MAQVQINITKGQASDKIEIVRQGVQRCAFDFPKKGPVPHDAVHVFVETALEMKRGFWGLIAEGANPAQIQEIAKEAGHASAKRARSPDVHIVELIQAERLVECFEAELWSPGADAETFRAVAVAACAASHVPCPDLADEQIWAIRKRIETFAAEWLAVPVGKSVRFHWPEHAASP